MQASVPEYIKDIVKSRPSAAGERVQSILIRSPGQVARLRQMIDAALNQSSDPTGRQTLLDLEELEIQPFRLQDKVSAERDDFDDILCWILEVKSRNTGTSITLTLNGWNSRQELCELLNNLSQRLFFIPSDVPIHLHLENSMTTLLGFYINRIFVRDNKIRSLKTSGTSGQLSDLQDGFPYQHMSSHAAVSSQATAPSTPTPSDALQTSVDPAPVRMEHLEISTSSASISSMPMTPRKHRRHSEFWRAIKFWIQPALFVSVGATLGMYQSVHHTATTATTVAYTAGTFVISFLATALLARLMGACLNAYSPNPTRPDPRSYQALGSKPQAPKRVRFKEPITEQAAAPASCAYRNPCS